MAISAKARKYHEKYCQTAREVDRYERSFSEFFQSWIVRQPRETLVEFLKGALNQHPTIVHGDCVGSEMIQCHLVGNIYIPLEEFIKGDGGE